MVLKKVSIENLVDSLYLAILAPEVLPPLILKKIYITGLRQRAACGCWGRCAWTLGPMGVCWSLEVENFFEK